MYIPESYNTVITRFDYITVGTRSFDPVFKVIYFKTIVYT